MEEKDTLVYKKSRTDKKTSVDEQSSSDTKTKVKSPSSNKQTTLDEITTSEKKENSKKKLNTVLKFAGILLTTILIPIILSAYEDTTDKWIQNLFGTEETKQQVSADSKQVNIKPTSNSQLKSDEVTLIKLNQLANNGKTINCLIPIGTPKESLLQNWGEPDSRSKLGLIEYWEYKQHHITIGVYKNRMIDIRSFDPSLQKLTLEQLKETGKPDKEYDHINLNQHILAYHMGKYKLRMVFPKPTKDEPSPKLINISLVDINYSN